MATAPTEISLNKVSESINGKGIRFKSPIFFFALSIVFQWGRVGRGFIRILSVFEYNSYICISTVY